MDTEARKRRRKRNQYRNKLNTKTNELEQITARITLLTLTGEEAQKQYEFSGLQRQKDAVNRKIARLRDILASLSPAYVGEKGNTS